MCYYEDMVLCSPWSQQLGTGNIVLDYIYFRTNLNPCGLPGEAIKGHPRV